MDILLLFLLIFKALEEAIKSFEKLVVYYEMMYPYDKKLCISYRVFITLRLNQKTSIINFRRSNTKSLSEKVI